MNEKITNEQLKRYIEIKKKYLYRIGMKIEYNRSKIFEESKSKPIPIPVLVSSDDEKI